MENFDKLKDSIKKSIKPNGQGEITGQVLQDTMLDIINTSERVILTKANSTNVTYGELKALRENSELVEGHLYRITDYEFTTVQADTKSAGHVFDIIVLATSESELSHLARAIAHEGDTYFDGNDLGAWELWYDLDNDTTKYQWADAENGKGVIYRMIDEKQNDCPYDFKNALFYNDKLTTNTTEDMYYYTFSYVVSGFLYDGTVEKQVTECYRNSMGSYIKNEKRSLNNNVWRNTAFGYTCYSNTFGNNCYSNTFEQGCERNTFGYGCRSNTFGYSCYSNTFGYTCYSNTFGNNCHLNTFGNNCYSNTFGNGLGSNTFGNNCYFNTFGYSCNRNTFGNNCYSNTFGNNCHLNTFGNNCYSNTFEEYISRRKIDSSNTSITTADEYYDDGSGQLVPVKHPDLSTQPSILPYKFMGNYVYEQLVPLTDLNSVIAIPSLAVNINLLVLSAEAVIFKDVHGADVNLFFGRMSATLPVNLTCDDVVGANRFKIEIDTDNLKSPNGCDFNDPDHMYLRIVYTSAFSEKNDYGYGYGDGSIPIPRSGFVFKVPQSKGVTQIQYFDESFSRQAAILIGSSNGYNYWHANRMNVQASSSEAFDLVKEGGIAVEGLEANIYKDGMTLVADAWVFVSGSYYMDMGKMPDATWVFTEIL